MKSKAGRWKPLHSPERILTQSCLIKCKIYSLLLRARRRAVRKKSLSRLGKLVWWAGAFCHFISTEQTHSRGDCPSKAIACVPSSTALLGPSIPRMAWLWLRTLGSHLQLPWVTVQDHKQVQATKQSMEFGSCQGQRFQDQQGPRRPGPMLWSRTGSVGTTPNESRPFSSLWCHMGQGMSPPPALTSSCAEWESLRSSGGT